MKRAIVLVLFIAAIIISGALWFKYHAAAPAPAAADKPAEEDAGPSVSHDDQGNTVLHMDDDAQGDAGIVVANPAPGQWNPEVEGYGRVLDPAPLATMANDLASAQVAATASAQEYDRQKILSGQNNTSLRALQTAATAAQHDQLSVQLARDRLTLAWGRPLATRDDLPALVQSLTTQQTALVRVDLAAGDALSAPPADARLVTLSGRTTEGKFLGAVSSVDPQSQSQGFIFSVQPNTLPLAPGQALTAFLKVPGDPQAGVIVPPDAVVRAEGVGWVYVMNKGGESFTRRQIPLDRSTDAGWFVAGTLKPGDFLAVTGAQTLLSEELKASLSAD